MTHSGTVSPSLATLTASGWQIAARQTVGGKNYQQLRCVALGDSITNQIFDEYTAGSFATQSIGYFSWAQIYTYGRLQLVADLGVTGETSRQVAARVGDALRYNADAVIGLMGANSLASFTAAQIIEDIRSVALAVVGSGRLYLAGMLTPYTGMDDVRQARLAEVNFRIQRDIAQIPGVVVWDPYSPCVDPTLASGGWLAAYSSDGLHPITAGGQRMGIALSEAVRPLFQDTNYRPLAMPGHSAGAGNLVYNPYMVGDNVAGTNNWTLGAGFTGQGPNGWTCNRYNGAGSAVISKIAESAETDTQQKRSWSRVACTFVGIGDGLVMRYDAKQIAAWVNNTPRVLGEMRLPTVDNGYAYRVIVAGTTAVGAGNEPIWPTTIGDTIVDATVTWECVPKIVAGKRFVAAMEFAINTVVGGALHPFLAASCRDTGGTILAEFIGNRRALGEVITDLSAPGGVIYTPEIIVPATCNWLQLNIGAFGTAGATGNIDITSVSLMELDANTKIGAYY